ncbi:MAG: DNA translocase FtsK [Ruminococcaceae bacterium]|nr:DNA translocase FtsK [Oscillospiraceae bacterium]
MANEKNKQSRTVSTSTAKKATGSGTKTRSAMAASTVDKDAPKSGAGSKNSSKSGAKNGVKSSPKGNTKPKAAADREALAKQAQREENRKNFSEQYMPYILGALGILTLIFFASYLFGSKVGPDDFWMGPVGYWFGYFFYGLFGWPAFFISVLLLYLAVFWRKNCKEETVVLRCVLSAVLIIFLSGLVHVFACAGDDVFAEIDFELFYESGAEFACGGVIGGLFGFLLYNGLRLWGTILVSILVLPLLVMFLVGVTPAQVVALIKKYIDAAKEARDARAEDEEEDEDDEAPARRRASKAKSRAEEDTSDEDEDEDMDGDEDEDDGYVPPRSRAKLGRDASDESNTRDRRAGREETIRVDARTGEIIEDADDDTADDEDYVAAPAKGKLGKPLTKKQPGRALSDRDTTGEPEDRATASATAESRDMNDHRKETPVEDDQEDTLYIPTRPSRASRSASEARKPAQRAAANRRDDGFASDDLPEDMESMEISWDEDMEDEPADAAERRVESAPSSKTPEPEKFVVVVNRQETAAVTSTTDYHVDGLSEEEVVLSSATGEVVVEEKQEYAFPPIDLLIPGPKHYEADEEEIVRNTQTLRSVLESFHIRVKEIACSCGPTITRYEVKPDTGVRVRSIANLVDDIALGLAKSGVRIEAPIPGKAAVGIEVPNDHAATVALRNLIETPEFMNHKSRLAACLGADVAGRPVMMDINKMPHLLVAGTTGSGKSVCINSIIMSILYKAKPDEVKLILIDPKKVEFAVYRDLPHLYCPLISDPKKAAGALNSAVVEMERRFELIEEVGVRNIAGYNEATAGDPERPPLPQMVIIIDELADLMMTASNEVETAICRLAQKARAAGIHLILGTQRPSVDVITGLIKANVPSRIAFTVSAAVDSRTIIDTVGAEKLIGRGDMLYSPVGSTKPMRVQGTFVSDGEVEKVVTFLKEHNAQIEYDESFMHMIEVEAAKCGQGKKKGGDVGNIEDFSALGGDDEDGKFWAAVEVAVDAEKISTSLLQRRLNLGYGRAAKIIDRMEEMGFVGPADGNKPRKLLITKQDLAEIRLNGRADAEE